MKQWSLPLTTLIVNSDFNRPDGIHVIEYSEYDALAKRVEELESRLEKAGISGRFGENFNEYYYVTAQERAKELTAAKAEIDELETQVGKLAIELGVPPDGWRIKGPKLEAELVAAKAEIEWLSGSFQEGVNNCCKHTERLKELETQRLEDTSEYMKLEEKFKELEQVIEGKYGGESRLLTAMSMAQQAEHRCRKAEKRVQELEAIDKTDHRYQPCVNEIERLKDREKALVALLKEWFDDDYDGEDLLNRTAEVLKNHKGN